MAIRMPRIMQAKQILRQSKLFANQATDVPKGYFAVYVVESQKDEIYSSNFILEPTIIPEVVDYNRERIRIQSSYGWSHNSLHKRGLH